MTTRSIFILTSLAVMVCIMAFVSLALMTFVSFTDISDNLPQAAVAVRSMDVEFADANGDGHLDVFIAAEFAPNRLLMGDGTGRFTDRSINLPQVTHDSEDIAVADFDNDGDLDVVFVSEDDQVNEYYLNDGQGAFSVGPPLPVARTTNAVLAADLNGDGAMDLLLGNQGANVILINDGQGGFVDESATRLPDPGRTTQDLELGDLNGDGLLDLIAGNEDGNQLWLGDGQGFFTAAALPTLSTEETREVDLVDVDGDGDLDVFLANVAFRSGRVFHNRLLINDGAGVFTDESDARLPGQSFHTVDADFVDLEPDGDLDLVLANAFGGDYEILLNAGSGTFQRDNDAIPAHIVGSGIDVEAADINGDGIVDLYLSRFDGPDFLLMGQVNN